MGRRPRSSGGGRAGRGGGGGGGGGPPALPGPDTIPGLQAWCDSRTTDWFAFSTGNSISGWVSRAGALGAIALTQGTFANQLIYVPSVAAFGNRPAVQCDGVNDYLDANNGAAPWAFFHNGLGSTYFVIEYAGSTGPVTQTILSTMPPGNTNVVGLYDASSPSSMLMRLGNGSGAYVNNWAPTAARDVARWRAATYQTGMRGSFVSGQSLTNADTGGAPSASAPALPLRISSSSASVVLKGFIPQVLVYDRVLTPAEITTLTDYFCPYYGIAA